MANGKEPKGYGPRVDMVFGTAIAFVFALATGLKRGSRN